MSTVGKRKPEPASWKEINAAKVNGKAAYGEYLRRGLWRCDRSPTGAHHWELDGADHGQCIYCGWKEN